MSAPPSRRPPDWYDANPHAKFSFTRLAAYRRCPAWFRYVYLDWHRSWTIPVLRAGHAVQEALERTFDADPGDDVDMESLGQRALARAKVVFDEAWAREEKAHEEDPNSYGPWDLDPERYLGYVKQGLLFHLGEVKARAEGRRPRTGEALDLPAVSGVGEAWAAVRPWHAPANVSLSESMETVPAGWFQGQYDLVYDWTGGRRIVDLKASGGKSAFSTEIELQLTSYAYMERALGRGRPEGIEAWFLGKAEPMVFPVPDDGTLDRFEAELHDLIEVSGSEKGFGEWNPEHFEPDPAEVPGHAPAPDEPSAWCRFCPAAFNCEKSAKAAPEPRDAVDFSRPPQGGAAALSGLVLGIAEPKEKPDGKVKRRFTLSNSTGACSLTWEEPGVSRLVAAGLRAGRHVRLTEVRPWTHPSSGNVLFFDSGRTALEVLE